MDTTSKKPYQRPPTISSTKNLCKDPQQIPPSRTSHTKMYPRPLSMIPSANTSLAPLLSMFVTLLSHHYAAFQKDWNNQRAHIIGTNKSKKTYRTHHEIPLRWKILHNTKIGDLLVPPDCLKTTVQLRKLLNPLFGRELVAQVTQPAHIKEIHYLGCVTRTGKITHCKTRTPSTRTSTPDKRATKISATMSDNDLSGDQDTFIPMPTTAPIPPNIHATALPGTSQTNF